jgi:hypothetical protein
MKSNCMKQVLAEGKVPLGHMVMEFGTQGIARILENAGLDFVIISDFPVYLTALRDNVAGLRELALR